MTNNLKLNGIVYKGVTNVQLPTEDGGVAVYTYYNPMDRFECSMVKATKTNINMGVLNFNENNKQFVASMVEATIKQTEV